MRLPKLDKPTRYAGLYVVDFGDRTAVGYTAREIAVLLESERFPAAQIYKIQRAEPNGRLELRGVSGAQLGGQAGFLFFRHEGAAAREDYSRLLALARENPAPVQAMVQVAQLMREDTPHVVAVLYEAAYDDEMSAWLSQIAFAGGDWVEGGTAALSSYHSGSPAVLERATLSGRVELTARSAEDVLASTHRAVQR